MKRVRSNSLRNPYERERAWLIGAFVCLLISIGAYMYYLSASVVHVVMRKEIDMNMNEVSTYVSTLETKYIEAQHSVSEDIATRRGFVRAEHVSYIDTGEETLVLRSE